MKYGDLVSFKVHKIYIYWSDFHGERGAFWILWMSAAPGLTFLETGLSSGMIQVEISGAHQTSWASLKIHIVRSSSFGTQRDTAHLNWGII